MMKYLTAALCALLAGLSAPPASAGPAAAAAEAAETAAEAEEAEEQAARWVARPGTSEHETGLAVDIVDTDYQLLDEKQEQTPVQQWLMAHCAEYGFILRYSTEKSDCTGIGYEPWHYRYVGKKAAREITNQNITLEEYLRR